MSVQIPYDTRLDLGVSVGLGLIQRCRSRCIFGKTDDVGQGAFRDMTFFTDDYVYPPDTGLAMQVQAAGNAGNTQTIRVVGLDEEGLVKTESVVITGNAATNLSGLWSRINFAENRGPDPLGGLCDITQQGQGAPIYAQIRPQEEQTVQGIFSVASDQKWGLVDLITSLRRDGNVTLVDFEFSYREAGGVFKAPFDYSLMQNGTSSIEQVIKYPMIISNPGITDVRLRVMGVTNQPVASQALGTILLFDKGS